MNLELKAAVQGRLKDRLIYVSLVDAVTNQLLETQQGMLTPAGEIEFVFEDPTNPVFIEIAGDTILKTCSSAALSPTQPLKYDFTVKQTQAFGSNQTEVEPGVWGLFNGDFNQDGSIDNTDVAVFTNDPELEGEMSFEELNPNVQESIHVQLPY